MAAGVQRDRMLTGLLQGMVDQTDVGMEKEDHGQMMSTGFQVRFLKISAKKWRIFTSLVSLNFGISAREFYSAATRELTNQNVTWEQTIAIFFSNEPITKIMNNRS